MSYTWDAFAIWGVCLAMVIASGWALHRQRASAAAFFLTLSVANLRGGWSYWGRAGHDISAWDWVTNPTIVFLNSLVVLVTLALMVAESYIWSYDAYTTDRDRTTSDIETRVRTTSDTRSDSGDHH